MDLRLAVEPTLEFLTVVIHVSGLFVIRQKFDRMLGQGELSRMRRIALLFMAGTTVSVTLLHGVEAGLWALAFRLLHALPDQKSATLFY
jgi:hypothetical protein